MKIRMDLALIVLLSVSLYSCKTTPATSEGKLIGGQAVSNGKYPATFLLRTGCTATKIADNLILTAAHCAVSREFMDIKPQYLPGSAEGMSLATNHTVRREDSDGDVTFRIKNTYVFPDYMEACKTTCNADLSVAFLPPNPPDLAIIEVELPNPTFSKIATARLAEGALTESSQVYVMGYGCEEGSSIAELGDLHFKENPTNPLPAKIIGSSSAVSREIVASFLKNFYQTPGKNWQNTDGQDIEAGASLCPGDSGGPLYVIENGEVKVAGINSFMVTPPNDEIGVSMFNAHARVDLESTPSVQAWLSKIARPVVPPQSGRNTENQTRDRDQQSLDSCRYCRLAVEIGPSLMKKDKKTGKLRPKNEWELLYQINGVLRAAGLKNWIYKNSIEVSTKHKKIWLNVKMLPGGTATTDIERQVRWTVPTDTIRAALARNEVRLLNVSSYVELLWKYKK